MSKSKTRPNYLPEVRERAVRMVLEQAEAHAWQWAAIEAIAPKIGYAAQTLRNWVAQAKGDAGVRAGLTSDERERMKALKRENRELRQANEILKRRRGIPPWRSSTAGRSDDDLHRREPR